VRPFDVDRLLRLAIAGVDVGSARFPGDEETRTLRVTLTGARSHAEGRPAFLERPSQAVLDRLFVPTAGGLAVPLGAVATTSFERSPVSIFHTNKVRSVSVTAEVAPGANTARVTAVVESALKGAKLPAAIRPVIAGERENSQETFGGMGAAILIAAFGILAVLVLEFGTFRATLIVASVIPLGVVGGLLGLFLTGNTLSFTATIGFIALLGIEVKNSILLVDFTNELRRGGMPLVEAVERAGEQRFLPILLTTATAIGGLLPLAIEHSALYSPLAIVLLGGLVASTLLARIVTPIVYLLLPPAVEMQVDPPLSGADAAAPLESPFAGAEAIV
jgi:multidrug efflux pump subunit AcrB